MKDSPVERGELRVQAIKLDLALSDFSSERNNGS
jgi:hypothetical protein